MNLVKSNWATFLDNEELMYIGSTFNKTLDEITTSLSNMEIKDFSIDRVYVGGKTNLKFNRPDGTISHLTKRGKVYLFDIYFLIHDEANDSVVIYRYC